MNLEVTGRVVAVVDDKNARLVVIDDGGGSPIAARFWGRGISETNGVMAGAVVRVSGALKSREWNGRWFTDFAADKLVITTAAPAAQQDLPPAQDDGDIPF